MEQICLKAGSVFQSEALNLQKQKNVTSRLFLKMGMGHLLLLSSKY